MKIQILDSATADVEEGILFYEAQKFGLGDYFLASIKADIERLRITAGVHPIEYGRYHRALCKVFPFAIYYLLSDDTAIVYAVVDCRRDPLWIYDHLSGS